VVTVVVVWVAVVKVLEERQPAEEPAAPVVVEEPGAEDVAPGVRVAPDVVDPAWELRYEAELDRLDQMRWTGLTEVDAVGDERPYHGKLTLVFGDGVQEAWPILEGSVAPTIRPAYLAALLQSKTLSVQFKRHPPVEVDLSWLEDFGPPQLLDSRVEQDGAVLTVRNPTIHGKTIRVRAGWQDELGWLEGDPPASAMQDVGFGPGETRTLTLAYAPSDRGRLGEPAVRTVVDPR